MTIQAKQVIDRLIWGLSVFLLSSFLIFDQYSWGKYFFILCSAAILLLSALQRGGSLWIQPRFFPVVLLLFTGYTALSSLWSVFVAQTLAMTWTLLRTWICFAMLYIAYSNLENATDMLLSVFVYASYVVAVYSLFYYGFDNIVVATHEARLDNEYANINGISIFLTMGIVCDLCLLLRCGFRLCQLVSILSILLLAASQSRKAIVIFVLGVLAVILYCSRRRMSVGTRILRVIFVVFSFAVLLYFFLKLPFFSGMNNRIDLWLNSLTGSGKADASSLVRNKLISIGLNTWLSHPLAGVGINATTVVSRQFFYVDYYMHNNYVELLCGGGLIGFLLYYAMHFTLLYRLFTYRNNNNTAFIISVVLVGMILVSDFGRVSYYSKTVLFELMMLFVISNKMMTEAEKIKDDRKLSKYLTKPDYRFLVNCSLGLHRNMSDEAYLERVYRARLGKTLCLAKPESFNEKLQWLKLHDHRQEYRIMADKAAVKPYVADILGESYVIPTLGVWQNEEEIDFDSLPERFVLKCTHDSGSVVVCCDKSPATIKKAKSTLRQYLKRDYYSQWREWPYRDIPHRVLAEAYLDGGENGLTDYKIHCFNGVPKLILVCQDRFSAGGMTEDFFTESWEHLDIRRPQAANASKPIPKPGQLSEMLQIAATLSKDLPFARIDLYNVRQRVYFSEITLYPASGLTAFVPDKWDRILGEWLTLPEATEFTDKEA